MNTSPQPDAFLFNGNICRAKLFQARYTPLISDRALHNITAFPTFSSAPEYSHIRYAGETAIHVSLCRGVDCLERQYVWFGAVS
jgi:hypothetical protein